MYGSVYYYYITNLQGDVMSIVDGSGNVVASYEYDPYGNVIEAAGILAEINPLRYRGYVYDSETDFYYLQSRFYDPAIGRFINADSYISTGQGIVGNNMFAYCGNNPVNCVDLCGHCFHHWKFWEDCEKCKENNATERTWENIWDTIQAIGKNIEFSAGIGQGIYGEFEFFETGVGVGMYCNFGTITYSQGEWSTGQELYNGLTFSLTPWLEFGAAEHTYRDADYNEEYTSWKWYNDTQETWTIFSVACYPIFCGGSISVGFDIVTFLEDVDVIWED